MMYRDTIAKWWAANIGLRESSAARGLAARLNRGDAVAVLAERKVFDLGHALGLLGQPERLVPLVQVLAAVRENGKEPLPRKLGGDQPRLSGLRFQRLLRAEGAELAGLIRRALPMADRTCNVGALGADLLHWNDETRARWAFDYFRESSSSLPDRLKPDHSAMTDEESDA